MSETRQTLVWIKRITLSVGIVFFSYFTVMTVIIPVLRFKISPPEVNSDDKKAWRPDNIWQLTVEDSLMKRAVDLKSREAFLLSRLEMTESDSISFAISLKDSSVSLVVQGVTIYSAKIRFYKVSHAFKKVNPFVLTYWLSRPFIVDTHFSSIPKTPVLYKKAPKDTIEAMSQLELDPLKNEPDPLHFTLVLDRKLVLNFEQSEKPERGYLRQLKVYKKEKRAMKRKNIRKNLVRFTPVEFVPEIKISLDRKAARVIYRAIPENALVALQLQMN